MARIRRLISDDSIHDRRSKVFLVGFGDSHTAIGVPSGHNYEMLLKRSHDTAFGVINWYINSRLLRLECNGHGVKFNISGSPCYK